MTAPRTSYRSSSHRGTSLTLFSAILLLVLQSCTLDLVEPDLFAARFFTTLVLRPDGGGERFYLDAKVEPGMDRRGRREILNPILEIDGSFRAPTLTAEGDPPAEYEWTNQTGIVTSPNQILRLLPPTISGLSAPSALELPAGIALLPEGPISLDEEGEDLVLHLLPPPQPPIFLRWSLSLTNLRAGFPFVLTVEGIGSWPEEIRVPASQLPPVGTFELKATVRVIAEFEPSSRVENYDVLGRIDFVMERRVSRGEVFLTARGSEVAR